MAEPSACYESAAEDAGAAGGVDGGIDGEPAGADEESEDCSIWRELKYGFGRLLRDTSGVLFWAMHDVQQFNGKAKNNGGAPNGHGAYVFRHSFLEK